LDAFDLRAPGDLERGVNHEAAEVGCCAFLDLEIEGVVNDYGAREHALFADASLGGTRIRTKPVLASVVQYFN
jgi:hypothetical protein